MLSRRDRMLCTSGADSSNHLTVRFGSTVGVFYSRIVESSGLILLYLLLHWIYASCSTSRIRDSIQLSFDDFCLLIPC